MTYSLRCARCGKPFEAKRPHAKYCTDRCRIRDWEQNGWDAEQAAGQRVARPLTQKDRVLYALRDAGEAGLRSDIFLKLSIPRAAARVKELREEGHQISSVREQQFTRYTLVGSSPGASASPEVTHARATSSEVTAGPQTKNVWVPDQPSLALFPESALERMEDKAA